MQCFVNRHKETQSKSTGMAVNVKVLRISKFPDTVLLVIYRKPPNISPGLIHGGAYILGGLYSEVYGM